MSEGPDRKGVFATASAFVIWGLFPLYWHALKTVPSFQIIAHRILWSAVLVGAWLLWRERFAWLRRIRASGALPKLASSSILIGLNWGIYVWAVNSGHVVESSLGYFVNPLLSVLLGVFVLHERLNGVQWLAMAVAACGVLWIAFHAGAPPWIALGIAASFALYGLVRKQVAVDAVAGMAVESLYLLVPALAYLLWCERGHGGGFVHGWGWGVDALLVLGGVVTAVPLVLFAQGVRRIPLTLVGILQYISPTLQLLIGVLWFGEPFDLARAVGFVLIWFGLLLFVGDGVLRARSPRVATHAS